MSKSVSFGNAFSVKKILQEKKINNILPKHFLVLNSVSTRIKLKLAYPGRDITETKDPPKKTTSNFPAKKSPRIQKQFSRLRYVMTCEE
jgi:hypothetical protein